MPYSFELISLAYQLWYSVFLSQQISEQYFLAWLFSEANRASEETKQHTQYSMTELTGVCSSISGAWA